MFMDLRTLEADADLNAPVCIVGAGAAGITMALELEAKGIGVLLLESGGFRYENDTQALYEGALAGHQNTDLTYSRLREFGGTTGQWTGLCAPLDPIDFEARPSKGNIAWPITRSDLDPFYARAQPYLELGDYRYDVDDWSTILSGTPLALPDDIISPAVYQHSPPTRFAERYREPIDQAVHVRCVLHANISDIVLNASGTAVDHIEVKTLEGQAHHVSANHFVLACGGIENARILLNARNQRPAGLGNENDLVGRYFMDHLNVEASRIVLADTRRDLGYYDQATDTTVLEIGLKVAEERMRAEDLLNNTAFMRVVWKDEAFNDDFRDHAWLSFSALAKTFARGEVPDRFAERTCNVLEAPGSIITGVSRNIQRRLSDGGEIDHIALRQDAEQAPDRNSRVMLNDDVDALGLNKVTLDWRVSRGDMESLRRSHEIIGQALGQSGIGRLQLGVVEPDDLSNVFTGYHHMGTTRMHDDPRQGVVDADCRLHSVANLYMAGSSVFTTVGTANPTLTITALAVRLADHIAQTSMA
ncbi:MAG: GMC oxidoreductase [Hyphomicrobiales bacterium]